MSTEESVDPRLVEQAQKQIRGLVDEIVGFSKQDASPEVFFGEFLNRVVSALAAVGGAVWSPGESGGLELQYQVNFREARMPDKQEDLVNHRRLVQSVFGSGEEALIPPHSGSPDQAPTPPITCLCSARCASAARPRASSKSFSGLTRRSRRSVVTCAFLQQMCELAGDYLKNRQLQHFTDRQALWGILEQFTRSVHGSLDPREVAFTIANEGRRLIDCDRLTVALWRGRKCKIEAISGQDTFDTRSNTVMLLTKLATKVLVGGEAVWYSGDATNLPPQIEEAVQEYVDDSHSKQVGVIPLRRPQLVGTGDEDKRDELPLGVLIIEQIEDIRPRDGMMQRVEVVCEHSSVSLGNAVEHNQMFLMPVWRTIGKSRWLVAARQLPWTVSAAIGIVVLSLMLAFVPYNFKISSDGQLLPVSRRDVFAPVDGTIERLLVRHGDKVQPKQLLAELQNTDLEVQLEELLGKRAAAQEQLQSFDRTLVEEGKRMKVDERNRIAGQRAETKQNLVAYEQQIRVVSAQREKLKVLCPISGEITTWNVEELLLRRPVRQGQVLLQVAETAGNWELELRMPEDRAGYLSEALRNMGKDLKVTYRLATDPGVDHEGRVTEVRGIADIHGEEGNTVLVKVAINKEDLDYLRPGADVMAKIHCGKRSLGYVWFHDVINFIHSRVLFKL